MKKHTEMMGYYYNYPEARNKVEPNLDNNLNKLKKAKKGLGQYEVGMINLGIETVKYAILTQLDHKIDEIIYQQDLHFTKNEPIPEVLVERYNILTYASNCIIKEINKIEDLMK